MNVTRPKVRTSFLANTEPSRWRHCGFRQEAGRMCCVCYSLGDDCGLLQSSVSQPEKKSLVLGSNVCLPKFVKLCENCVFHFNAFLVRTCKCSDC